LVNYKDKLWPILSSSFDNHQVNNLKLTSRLAPPSLTSRKHAKRAAPCHQSNNVLSLKVIKKNPENNNRVKGRILKDD